MKIRNVLAILTFKAVIFSAVSCQSESITDNENSQIKVYLDDGRIDGYKLTLGVLSDLLDEGLTIEKTKELLGKNPLVRVDGDTTELRYAVHSNDLHQNGMRITTISITFKNGVMLDSSIGFTGFYD